MDTGGLIRTRYLAIISCIRRSLLVLIDALRGGQRHWQRGDLNSLLNPSTNRQQASEVSEWSDIQVELGSEGHREQGVGQAECRCVVQGQGTPALTPRSTGLLGVGLIQEEPTPSYLGIIQP